MVGGANEEAEWARDLGEMKGPKWACRQRYPRGQAQMGPGRAKMNGPKWARDRAQMNGPKWARAGPK